MIETTNSRQRNLALAGAAVLVGGALAWWVASRGPAPAVYDIPRTVRYSLTVKNPSNEFVSGASFWVFAPVVQTAFQRVQSIDASLPYAVEADEFGNQRLFFTADIPPYGTKTVRIDAQLELAHAANEIGLGDTNSFLQAEDKIESNSKPIAELGQRLTRRSDTETADAIFNWVSASLEYTGYVKSDRGALYALNERRGDCTEYSYLYTALARSADIATRPMGGFVTAENAVVRARDIHNWAEVKLDGKWRVVDPQNKRNRVDEHHHIAMRVLGAAGEGLTSTHQMIGAEDGLEIRLN